MTAPRISRRSTLRLLVIQIFPKFFLTSDDLISKIKKKKRKEMLDETSIRSRCPDIKRGNVRGNVPRGQGWYVAYLASSRNFTIYRGGLRRRGDEPGNAILPRWREEGEGGGVERLRLSVKGR